MRLLVLFDLPVKTKRQRRKYSQFRKFLISRGYLMLQYSVYVKILNNRDAAKDQIKVIKNNVPKEGHVRILMLTEKQFSRMEIIVGGKSKHEDIITTDPFILL